MRRGCTHIPSGFDSCVTIAAQYGLSPSLVQSLNPSADCTNFGPGARLNVCTPPCSYTTLAGDTCATVASAYGLSSATLLRLNPVIALAGFSCTSLPAGLVLGVCPSGLGPCAYTTVAGDTCSSIGAKFQLSTAQLTSNNPTLSCSSPQVGAATMRTVLGSALCNVCPRRSAPCSTCARRPASTACSPLTRASPSATSTA